MESARHETQILTEYERSGRDFLTAAGPIIRYYLKYTNNNRIDSRGLSPFISPKGGNSGLFVLHSDGFPGWIDTKERPSGVHSGISIAKYDDNIDKPYKLFKLHTKQAGSVTTRFNILPDEIFLASFRQVKFNNDSYIRGIVLAEYTKEHLLKHVLNNDEAPWDLESSVGIANIYHPYKERWKKHSMNLNGLNMMRDVFLNGLPLGELTWPVIVYDPRCTNQEDPLSWDQVKIVNGLNDDKLPQTVTWNTPEIKRLTEKWLKPFSSGIQEV